MILYGLAFCRLKVGTHGCLWSIWSKHPHFKFVMDVVVRINSLESKGCSGIPVNVEQRSSWTWSLCTCSVIDHLWVCALGEATLKHYWENYLSFRKAERQRTLEAWNTESLKADPYFSFTHKLLTDFVFSTLEQLVEWVLHPTPPCDKSQPTKYWHVTFH